MEQQSPHLRKKLIKQTMPIIEQKRHTTLPIQNSETEMSESMRSKQKNKKNFYVTKWWYNLVRV